MFELYFIPNGTILPHTMIIPPIELLEPVQFTDLASLQYLKWSSLWNS